MSCPLDGEDYGSTGHASERTIRWNGSFVRSDDELEWLAHFRTATRHWCFVGCVHFYSHFHQGGSLDPCYAEARIDG